MPFLLFLDLSKGKQGCEERTGQKSSGKKREDLRPPLPICRPWLAIVALPPINPPIGPPISPELRPHAARASSSV